MSKLEPTTWAVSTPLCRFPMTREDCIIRAARITRARLAGAQACAAEGMRKEHGPACS